MHADEQFDDNMFEEDLLSMNLINYEFVPTGIISGLTTEQLNNLTSSTAEITRERDQVTYPEADIVPQQEYPELGNQIQAEMNRIEEEMKVQSTAQQTKSYSRKLKQFLSAKNLPDNIETMPVSVLSSYLRFYYSQLRKKDGSYYSSRTLICIRAGIHRYLTQAPVNRSVNILNGVMFQTANNMLASMVGHFLQSGQPPPQQASEISEDDFRLLSTYFHRRTPDRLQKEIWFNTEYHFGMRGRENMRQFTISSFVLCCDSNNKTYLKINENLLSKNVKASLNTKEFSDMKQAKMYEDRDQPNKCPIVAFLLYKRKLEDRGINKMWPKPIENEKMIEAGLWYYQKAVTGKNLLGEMMSTISEESKLSKRYTNHSIRATVINRLRDKGFKKEQICKITGHKNPRSLDSYFRKRCTDDESFSMNRSLQSSLHGTASTSTDHEIRDDIYPEPQQTVENSHVLQFTNNQNFLIARAPSNKKMKLKCDGETNIVEIEFI